MFFFYLCYEWNVCFLNKNCSQCYDETSTFWDLFYQTLLLVWVSFGAEINCLVKIRVSNDIEQCLLSTDKKQFFLPYTDYYTLMRLASNYIYTVYVYIYILFFITTLKNIVLVWSPKINRKFEKKLLFILIIVLIIDSCRTMWQHYKSGFFCLQSWRAAEAAHAVLWAF